MTDRQKFWLKVVLAVTFPVWAIPAAVIGLAFGLGLVIWWGICDIVDPCPSHGLGGWR